MRFLVGSLQVSYRVIQAIISPIKEKGEKSGLFIANQVAVHYIASDVKGSGLIKEAIVVAEVTVIHLIRHGEAREINLFIFVRSGRITKIYSTTHLVSKHDRRDAEGYYSR